MTTASDSDVNNQLNMYPLTSGPPPIVAFRDITATINGVFDFKNFDSEDKLHFKQLWKNHLGELRANHLVYYLTPGMVNKMGYTVLEVVAQKLSGMLKTSVGVYIDTDHFVYQFAAKKRFLAANLACVLEVAYPEVNKAALNNIGNDDDDSDFDDYDDYDDIDDDDDDGDDGDAAQSNKPQGFHGTNNNIGSFNNHNDSINSGNTVNGTVPTNQNSGNSNIGVTNIVNGTVPNFGSRSKKTLGTQIKAGQRIPKPRNKWIIYRQDHHKIVSEKNPGMHTSQISTIIASMWAKASAEVKSHYQALADMEKQRHNQLYPGYTCTPRKSSAIKKRKAVKKMAYNFRGNVNDGSESIIGNGIVPGSSANVAMLASAYPQMPHITEHFLQTYVLQEAARELLANRI